MAASLVRACPPPGLHAAEVVATSAWPGAHAELTARAVFGIGISTGAGACTSPQPSELAGKSDTSHAAGADAGAVASIDSEQVVVHVSVAACGGASMCCLALRLATYCGSARTHSFSSTIRSTASTAISAICPARSLSSNSSISASYKGKPRVRQRLGAHRRMGRDRFGLRGSTAGGRTLMTGMNAL